MRYKIVIGYEGTRYAGWQVQKNAEAIQPIIQRALETILREKIDLTGSSRTDAGVHAKGQVAHFDTDKKIDPAKVLRSLNGLLPEDIRVFTIEPVFDDFHARYSALSKIYHYHLHLDPVSNPFKRKYSHQVFPPFDLEKLIQGTKYFIGTHDFASFANVKKEKNENTLRALHRLDVREEIGGIRLEFEGSGFLYKMVRNITGTLLDVAAGKIKPEEIPFIFEKKARSEAGSCAPAKGLFLIRVQYPPQKLSTK